MMAPRASQPDEDEVDDAHREAESVRPTKDDANGTGGRVIALERDSMEHGNDLADMRFRVIRIETRVNSIENKVDDIKKAIAKLAVTVTPHVKSKASSASVVGVVGIVAERVLTAVEDPKMTAHPQSLVVLLLALVAMLYTQRRAPALPESKE
jgi:hypothetical protein